MMKTKRTLLTIRLWLAVVALLMSASSFAQISRDEEDVAAREQAWSESWVSGDIATLESLHDPDYFAINNLGQVTTREQVLADVRAGIFRYTGMFHEKMIIRVYGTIAIVNGITINEGHRGNRDVSGMFAYTRVYRKNNGVWRAILSHYTRTSPPL